MTPDDRADYYARKIEVLWFEIFDEVTSSGTGISADGQIELGIVVNAGGDPERALAGIAERLQDFREYLRRDDLDEREKWAKDLDQEIRGMLDRDADPKEGEP